MLVQKDLNLLQTRVEKREVAKEILNNVTEVINGTSKLFNNLSNGALKMSETETYFFERTKCHARLITSVYM